MLARDANLPDAWFWYTRLPTLLSRGTDSMEASFKRITRAHAMFACTIANWYLGPGHYLCLAIGSIMYRAHLPMYPLKRLTTQLHLNKATPIVPGACNVATNNSAARTEDSSRQQNSTPDYAHSSLCSARRRCIAFVWAIRRHNPQCGKTPRAGIELAIVESEVRRLVH